MQCIANLLSTVFICGAAASAAQAQQQSPQDFVHADIATKFADSTQVAVQSADPQTFGTGVTLKLGGPEIQMQLIANPELAEDEPHLDIKVNQTTMSIFMNQTGDHCKAKMRLNPLGTSKYEDYLGNHTSISEQGRENFVLHYLEEYLGTAKGQRSVLALFSFEGVPMLLAYDCHTASSFIELQQLVVQGKQHGAQLSFVPREVGVPHEYSDQPLYIYAYDYLRRMDVGPNINMLTALENFDRPHYRNWLIPDVRNRVQGDPELQGRVSFNHFGDTLTLKQVAEGGSDAQLRLYSADNGQGYTALEIASGQGTLQLAHDKPGLQGKLFHRYSNLLKHYHGDNLIAAGAIKDLRSLLDETSYAKHVSYQLWGSAPANEDQLDFRFEGANYHVHYGRQDGKRYIQKIVVVSNERAEEITIYLQGGPQAGYASDIVALSTTAKK